MTIRLPEHATPNPEPWSDALPRILCTTRFGNRVVLDSEGVHVEHKRTDRLGAISWQEADNWWDSVDNLNLDLDDWLESRYDATGCIGAFVESGDEGFSLYTSEDGKRFYAGRDNKGVFRRLSSTGWYEMYGVSGPANAWILLEGPDGKSAGEAASRIKCSLAYRLLGGDPAIKVTLVPQ